jgi:hypothetical protein
MQLDRIGVKLFAIEPEASKFDIRSFIPVFHSWIQRHSMPDHLLIDVHDYSHIHHGPGILLVAHQANFSLDQAEGRLGLLYLRKQPLEGALDERIAAVLAYAVEACQLLEPEGLQFKDNELLVFANDRLNAPNDESTSQSLTQATSAALSRLGRSGLRVAVNPSSPKERSSVIAHK